MKLTQNDLDERQDRIDAGEGTDEDLRLTKLYGKEGFEPSPVEEISEEPKPDADKGSDEGGETPSPGNSTEQSSGTTDETNGTPNTDDLSPAQTTESPSKSGHGVSSTARPTGGSGKVRR